jgi:hypothetical protein
MLNLLILIILIFYISYNIYSNQYKILINELKKNNMIIPLEYNKKVLEYPLNEFYISTSHNSYLNSIQHASFVDLNILKNILLLGARCIELDISHINNIPIVAHGTKDFITTSYIYLDKMIDIIIKYGLNISDPLIIFFEIFNLDNKELAINIKNILINKFNTKIAKLSINTNNYIADQPIKLFLNKIILFGTIDKYNILTEIFYSTNNFLNRDHEDNRLLSYNNSTQLSRVYHTEGIGSVLSLNYNFIPLWKNNYKLIALNFQMKDKLLYNYLQFFKNKSFIHKSELII